MYGDKKDDDKKEYDPELVLDATPAVDNGPPIPPGHRRFYCEKCRVVRSVIGKRNCFVTLVIYVVHCVLVLRSFEVVFRVRKSLFVQEQDCLLPPHASLSS